ncbi:MAG: hypothetical protein ACOZIN_20140 [Myxococcota bacterium]
MVDLPALSVHELGWVVSPVGLAKRGLAQRIVDVPHIAILFGDIDLDVGDIDFDAVGMVFVAGDMVRETGEPMKMYAEVDLVSGNEAVESS